MLYRLTEIPIPPCLHFPPKGRSVATKIGQGLRLFYWLLLSLWGHFNEKGFPSDKLKLRCSLTTVLCAFLSIGWRSEKVGAAFKGRL